MVVGKHNNGAFTQQYKVSLRYERTVNEDDVLTESKVEKSVSLDVAPYAHGDPFKLAQLIPFRNGTNKILAEARDMMRAGVFIIFRISISAHISVPEYTDEYRCSHTTQQVNSVLWQYGRKGDDLDLEDDETGGLCMRPDGRCSSSNRDAFFPWAKDFLESMGENCM